MGTFTITDKTVVDAVVDAHEWIVSETGTFKKASSSQMWDYIEGKVQGLSNKDAPVSADILTIQDTAASNALKECSITNFMKALDLDGMTAIGAALVDADLLLVDDGAGGTNRSSAMSRVYTYIQTKIQAQDAKTAPVSADILMLQDSESSSTLKECTISNLMKAFDIASITDIDAALADADEIIVDDGGAGTIRRSDVSRVWTYVVTKIQALSAKTAPVSADILTMQDTADSNILKEVTVTNFMKSLDIDGMTGIGAGLADADLIIVDDGAGGTNRSAAMSRVWTYIWSKFTGATAKTTPVSADLISIQDSADSSIIKEMTIANLFSSVDKVTYKASTELTISVGAVVTVTQAFHTIDTNADGASDDLETIAGLVAGTWYTFMAAHTARSIVFKTGSDNIVCNGAADLTMDSTNDIVKGFSPDGTNIFCYLAVQGG